ncbi:hypothetical protein OG234_13460 [Streptomyces sp. NBC_01420]|uniref:hypothetical protein n=1 Tax=Streptomyces sp. NBC_01420 TaxID=2903858 RepID=UPI003245D212
MAKVTDRPLGMPGGVTDEHKNKAAAVLARLARRYAEEDPGAPVDDFAFVMRAGAEAYDVTGRSLAGAHRIVAALVRQVAPATGTGCGAFAAGLYDGARAYGWSDDDNQPVIPRHNIPAPRPSEESGRVPAPRPKQAAGPVAADDKPKVVGPRVPAKVPEQPIRNNHTGAALVSTVQGGRV